MELNKIDKLKQKFCRHKNAVGIGSTRFRDKDDKRVYFAEHYCCRCGKTFDRIMDVRKL